MTIYHLIRGYVTLREFAGLSIIVPAQNSCLREYARSMNQAYCLPLLEHKFENCYMQLFTTINNATINDTIAMYSISMMPIKDQKKLSILRDSAIKKRVTFAFILEGVRTKDLFTLSSIIQSYSLREIIGVAGHGPLLETIRVCNRRS